MRRCTQPLIRAYSQQWTKLLERRRPNQSALLQGWKNCRSFKPEKHAERLRGVGNSSGDENGSDSMKYWEIIADKLSVAGWTWGYCSTVTRNGWRWVVDAHKTDGPPVHHSF